MAISKGKILNTLEDLESLYQNTTQPNLQIYYSKLALLELCGWLEQAIDDVVLQCAKRCLKNNQNMKYIKEQIKKNSAFDYENNFRDLLIKVIGLMNFEKLERNVKPISLVTFSSTLSSLKSSRNSHAHTHIKGCTAQVNAPSWTKGDFMTIFTALKDYELTLKRLKL
jgi:hypothetical protein